MARVRDDFIYCEEFAQPGEGKSNNELWVACAWALMGCDPRLICRDLSRKERDKKQRKEHMDERNLAVGE